MVKKLPNHPHVLYVRGNPQALQLPMLAIVGTRKMTEYGQFVVNTFISQLVEAGLCIVSGLAFGIDSAAHRATLNAQGKTIAVLPSGLDIITPPSHQSLAQEIVEQGGCLISEHKPGTPAMKHQFILRNRIIAGITLGTLVIEAGEKSGALITAHWAAEYGRPVFAVPGSISSEASEGTKKLVNEGAMLVTSTQDILSELSMLFPQPRLKKQTNNVQSQAQEKIANIINASHSGSQLEEIVQKSALPVQVVQAELTLLEMQQAIERIGPRFFAKNK